jgi:16S rRNA (guanine527-N7)-methyltransferase
VSADTISSRIASRFNELGVAISGVEHRQLSDYFCLLAKWNSRINLTSLPVESPEDPAIDRLLVEPILASRLVSSSDRLCVDLGSGGGSPGFPLKVGAAWLRMVLVESKERKSAFLRDVARSLSVEDVEVRTSRFELLSSDPDIAGLADIVSLRAVRADEALWGTVSALLKQGGRAFWFGGEDSATAQGPLLTHESTHPLGSGESSRVVILRKN